MNKIKYVQYQESTHDRRQKIISLAEKTKIFQEYTTLNDNFKQRLENENCYQDEKMIGKKRPILESPSKWSDLEDETDENPGRIDQPLIFTLRTEEEEDKEVETEASPSEKNGGKKKKKKKNKKK
ncbi:hypothetical protein RhiirC2_777746 [Rhizophagus irregularis]|uniref:Uncharacterized protein n=1 Tax=Rhizophagus irregularis TaxID=588596 RepID=A0A2N1NDL5_9GLOM|nr:hypothetical protein RhiirC2_777746 [Rhizophagus irregularis]